MREILFRGKRLKDGKWIYGAFCPKDWEAMDGPMIDKPSIINLEPPLDGFWYAVYPASVGQFTGLLDKNGKKIFEGDIIRYADIYDYNCYLESLENPEAYEGTEYSDIWTIDEVVYGIAINYPAFDLNRHSFEANGLSELSESSGYFYEVIGNIHDNPELMRAQS